MSSSRSPSSRRETFSSASSTSHSARGIRVVPYSPPRAAADGTQSRRSSVASPYASPSRRPSSAASANVLCFDDASSLEFARDDASASAFRRRSSAADRLADWSQLSFGLSEVSLHRSLAAASELLADESAMSDANSSMQSSLGSSFGASHTTAHSDVSGVSSLQAPAAGSPKRVSGAPAAGGSGAASGDHPASSSFCTSAMGGMSGGESSSLLESSAADRDGRPSTAHKRRNLLTVSSNGKTFSLTPLAPAAASASSATSPPSPFAASPSKAQSQSRPPDASSNTPPRPLPSAPTSPVAIPAGSSSSSIRTASASATSVFSSSLSSSASSTIRPVFDSPRLSSSAFSASTTTSRAPSCHRRLSEDTFSTVTRPSSTVVSLSSPVSSSPSPKFDSRRYSRRYSRREEAGLEPDLTAASITVVDPEPWDQPMVGGLRQVPHKPQTLQPDSLDCVSPTTVARFSVDDQARVFAAEPALPAAKRSSVSSAHRRSQPAAAEPPHPVYPDLNEKSSFQSETTLSETSNYKIYARSSSPPVPDDALSLAPSLDSNTNVQILGHSSPPASIAASAADDDLDTTILYSDDEDNFVVHNVSELPASSSPPASPTDSVVRLQPEFSQESLRVAPLRPDVKVTPAPAPRPLSASSDSNATLRHAPSADSLCSAFSLESAQSLLATPAALYIHRASILNISSRSGPATPTAASATGPESASTSTQSLLTSDTMSHHYSEPWNRYSAGSSSIEGASSGPSAGPSLIISPIEAHPHKWSDQLSTVMSESEPSTTVPNSPVSRSNSMASFANSNGGRLSIGHASSINSRRMPSISSSIAGYPEPSSAAASSSARSHSRSNSASVDRPLPAYHRAANGLHVIHHVDEHGDGLGELNTLQSRPSRTRLGSIFSNISSDRGLHSSSSSRAASLSPSSIPTWARLYYGSGERRFLSPTTEGSDAGDSRPGSRHSATGGARPTTADAPLETTHSHPRPGGHVRRFSIRAQIRKQTSSIWSPHLRQDRRTIQNRYSSMWDPPSVAWASGGSGGVLRRRRNAQVVGFIVGFVFPLAWMLAAVLPLPDADAEQKLMEDGLNRSGDVSSAHEPIVPSQPQPDDTLHLRMLEAARWWRRLNRYMSVVGVLVLGAMVALIVVGVNS
ncbi:hypothetical protein BROUX41_001983 [Berkeleyomyces rouxiae]